MAGLAFAPHPEALEELSAGHGLYFSAHWVLLQAVWEAPQGFIAECSIVLFPLISPRKNHPYQGKRTLDRHKQVMF